MAVPAEDRLAPLVVAAQKGDTAATDQLLREIFPSVVSYCRSRITWSAPGHASADDVAQEICLSVVTGIPKYQDQGSSFMAFVYGIAAHKVADAKRNAFRHTNDVLDDSTDIVDVSEEPHYVEKVQQRLRIFLLFFLHQLRRLFACASLLVCLRQKLQQCCIPLLAQFVSHSSVLLRNFGRNPSVVTI